MQSFDYVFYLNGNIMDEILSKLPVFCTKVRALDIMITHQVHT